MTGKLGPTAQYWCMYVFMINQVSQGPIIIIIIIIIVGSCIAYDLDGYINILQVVIDLFFVLNRLNYAQWGVRFVMDV